MLKSSIWPSVPGDLRRVLALGVGSKYPQVGKPYPDGDTGREGLRGLAFPPLLGIRGFPRLQGRKETMQRYPALLGRGRWVVKSVKLNDSVTERQLDFVRKIIKRNMTASGDYIALTLILKTIVEVGLGANSNCSNCHSCPDLTEMTKVPGGQTVMSTGGKHQENTSRGRLSLQLSRPRRNLLTCCSERREEEVV